MNRKYSVNIIENSERPLNSRGLNINYLGKYFKLLENLRHRNFLL
nr:MAG TPA: hypothetical protein [Bacteriophage sp.]